MKSIVSQILKSTSLVEERESIATLFKLYKEIDNDFFKKSSKNKSFTTNYGIALSPLEAINCIEDANRTARFIKGIYKAILDLTHENKVVQILYAGSGPYGTLLLPLFALFTPEQIQVTFLDIHKSAIDTLTDIVCRLGFQSHIRESIVCDATTFDFDTSIYYQLIVSETMDKALIKEPQVMITKNLLKVLSKDGILIPEKIQLTTQHSFFSNEPKFKKNQTSKLPNDILRSKIEKQLFSITKSTVFDNDDDFYFCSDVIDIKEIDKRMPDICIYTTITIYKDVLLKSAESFITNPYCVASLYTLKNSSYQLVYSIKGVPSWKLKK